MTAPAQATKTESAPSCDGQPRAGGLVEFALAGAGTEPGGADRTNALRGRGRRRTTRCGGCRCPSCRSRPASRSARPSRRLGGCPDQRQRCGRTHDGSDETGPEHGARLGQPDRRTPRPQGRQLSEVDASDRSTAGTDRMKRRYARRTRLTHGRARERELTLARVTRFVTVLRTSTSCAMVATCRPSQRTTSPVTSPRPPLRPCERVSNQCHCDGSVGRWNHTEWSRLAPWKRLRSPTSPRSRDGEGAPPATARRRT
jgi:hypothetical protein